MFSSLGGGEGGRMLKFCIPSHTWIVKGASVTCICEHSMLNYWKIIPC